MNILPRSTADEIIKLCCGRGRDTDAVSEIRLRSVGKSSFKIDGERIDLCSEPNASELERTFHLLCGGALYAHRDTVREGFISYEGGVRVGICGEARYEGGELIGISNISSLIFRIPLKVRPDIGAVKAAWKNCSRGMLIYSPPGFGKTTSLRMLAHYIAGSEKRELAIIDTRREFCAEDYAHQSVDILSGYRRDAGLDIALRTLSPDVIMVDEIGGVREAEAMLESLNSGVKVIATAHAASLGDLKKRKNLSAFFENEIFDTFVGISIEDGRRVVKIEGEQS